MNLHFKKYTLEDAKALNLIQKQLKSNPIFSKYESPEYTLMERDYRYANMEINRINVKLFDMDLESEESFNKYIQFFKERMSPKFYRLNLFFNDMSNKLYQKAFELIDELLKD